MLIISKRHNDDFLGDDCRASEAAVLGQTHLQRLVLRLSRLTLDDADFLEHEHLSVCWFNEKQDTAFEVEELGEFLLKGLAKREMLLQAHEDAEGVENVVRSALGEQGAIFDDQSIKDRCRDSGDHFEGIPIPVRLKFEFGAFSVLHLDEHDDLLALLDFANWAHRVLAREHLPLDHVLHVLKLEVKVEILDARDALGQEHIETLVGMVHRFEP